MDVEEEVECEWLPDPEDQDEEEELETCGAFAACLVYDRYVSDHLCARHAADARAEQGDEGLRAFMQSTGLEEDLELLPIQENAKCDYIGDLNSETACGKEATHAMIITSSTALCEAHAAEV